MTLLGLYFCHKKKHMPSQHFLSLSNLWLKNHKLTLGLAIKKKRHKKHRQSTRKYLGNPVSAPLQTAFSWKWSTFNWIAGVKWICKHLLALFFPVRDIATKWLVFSAVQASYERGKGGYFFELFRRRQFVHTCLFGFQLRWTDWVCKYR